MRTLVFDTETTGVWNFKDSFYGQSQPGLCQLAAQLYDDRKVVGEINLIIRPLGIIKGGEVSEVMIPDEASAIHGITNDMVDKLGIPYKVALPMFNNLLRLSDRVVAFNTAFDSKVMKCAYHRISANPEVLDKTNYKCAMLSAAQATKLPAKYGTGYGWPKLQDAYKFLVDPNGFENAHDAMADVRAAAAVLFALEDQGYEILNPGN